LKSLTLAIRDAALQTAKSRGQKFTDTSWAVPAPVGDHRAYLARRTKRGQHKLVYYKVPPLHISVPHDVQQSTHHAPCIYYDFTPYEIIRRTIDQSGE
jgi:hypothetical protein